MRVVIGEDEALLREGLVLVLEHAGIEVAGSASDADEVVDLRPPAPARRARHRHPHAPDPHRRRAARGGARAGRGAGDQASSSCPSTSSAATRASCWGTRAAGVGYLLKYRIADGVGFCDDLRRVADGGTVLDPEVVGAMMARRDDALDHLGPRRRQVLALIAEGRTNSAIARRLSITEKAVVAHSSGIYDALGLAATDEDHRRVLAVVRYLTR